MKTLKLAIPAAVLMAGFMVCTSASYGKPEYAKKEATPDGKNRACVYCHVAMGKKDLNDTGKCYQKNDHSLAKCAAPAPAGK
jgi:cytochrome c553